MSVVFLVGNVVSHKKTILVALLAVVASLSMTALAQADEVSFSGQLISTTCKASFSADGSNWLTVAPLTVALPTIGVNSLRVGEGGVGRTSFKFRLEHCPAPEPSYSVNFGSPNVDMSTGALIIDGGIGAAENVEIRLSIEPTGAGAGTVIDLRDVIGNQNVPFVQASGVTGIRTFYVEYIATGPVKPGVVKATVAYDIIYQ